MKTTVFLIMSLFLSLNIEAWAGSSKSHKLMPGYTNLKYTDLASAMEEHYDGIDDVEIISFRTLHLDNLAFLLRGGDLRETKYFRFAMRASFDGEYQKVKCFATLAFEDRLVIDYCKNKEFEYRTYLGKSMSLEEIGVGRVYIILNPS